MISTETAEKITPVKMPADLRARFEVQRGKDKRGVHDEILVLIDEALRLREKRR